ncbi:acetyl/propionyl/methylcrotonyl-CoA carboxylase subunit alpha [Peterkaempfera griseoplana]|uniref:acetyl/propionyl/methylcrotonyl-CoA carboxylase subunit alpha n=1 Tax=Peterkaempfera griseoplana TaxID=66896 RepID=UPI0006E3863C|nr:biotin carboxylase N-terminal domain-containing protein [Peterkaempfera griseoplana]
MISSVLVANRGEIARRVLRTCRDAGIVTVAVHSDPDAEAPYVREADAAVRLPGAAPADTYLRADLLVAAALAAGADAVHPGYGFLSENAAFARAVLDAGLLWIGPPPDAMAAMGSKTEAKRLMAAAGVPVLTAVDPATATEAELPLLVKAAAGGGGRGMRIVRGLADLDGELTAARAEAASAFGDAEVFCEPYVETGRHVEVQLLADSHGTVWAVGDRDCSVQRRHQKVIEEAPAPGIPGAVRSRLHEAARTAARAIGYTGAGTAEFLLAGDGRFFFLEMNTRLQVEHPATECTTGLDLVAWQLRIAEGAALPAEPPGTRGHAVEARLYAEDPAEGWQPQSGPLHLLDLPGVDTRFGPHPADAGLRLDSGVEDGSTVTVHYDAMLAKVIAWAPTRAEAARRLAGALARARIHGPATNRDLLVRVLRHPAFLAGEVHTGFLEQHHAEVVDPGAKDGQALAALAAALADAAANRAAAPVLAGLPAAWRNVPSGPQTKRYRCGETEHEVRYRRTRDGLRAEDHPGVRLLGAEPDRVVLEADGVRRTFGVARHGDTVHVDSPLGAVTLTAVSRFPDPAAHTVPGSLLAPMPGTVVRTAVAEGDTVTAGQTVLWLEAMKMEHRVTAPTAGTVAQLRVRPGQQVEPGALLAVVTQP